MFVWVGMWILLITQRHMGRAAWGLRLKSSHDLPSSIEQIPPTFSHRRCDTSLWSRPYPQTISTKSLLHLPYTSRWHSSSIQVDVCVEPLAAACCCLNISVCWEPCSEAMLPFPVQCKVRSRWTWRRWRVVRLVPEWTALRRRLLALSQNSIVW